MGIDKFLKYSVFFQIFGHISGAHLNPAVTLSTVLLKMLSPAMGVVYVAGQFLGATFGFALLKVSTTSSTHLNILIQNSGNI